jgi:hypothetical protein
LNVNPILLSDFERVSPFFLDFHGFGDCAGFGVEHNNYAAEVLAEAGGATFWTNIVFGYEVAVDAGFLAHAAFSFLSVLASFGGA